MLKKYYFIVFFLIQSLIAISQDSLSILNNNNIEAVFNFSKKYFVAKTNNKWHLIPKSNITKSINNFDHIFNIYLFKNDDELEIVFPDSLTIYPIFRKNKWGFINHNGEIVINPKFYLVRKQTNKIWTVKTNDGWGYINDNGKLISNEYFEECHEFHKGIAAVKKNGLWGFINEDGTWFIEPRFSDVGTGFIGQYAIVSVNKLKGLINRQKEYIIKPSVNSITLISDSIVNIGRNKNIGVINNLGDTIIPARYFEIEYFGLGLFRCQNEKGYFICDTSFSNYLNKKAYEEINWIDEFNIFIARRNGNRYIFKNPNHILFSDSLFFNIQKMYGSKYLRIRRCSKNGCLYGAFSKNIELVIPIEYEEISPLDDGMLGVKKNNKFGVVDSVNNVIVPIEFDERLYFIEGVSKTRKNGILGYINSKGEIINKNEYYKQLAKIRPYNIKSDGKSEYAVTKTGKILFKNWGFRSLVYFDQGIFRALSKYRYYGLIKPNGKIIQNFNQKNVILISEGMFAFHRNGKWGYKDLTGKIIIHPKFNEAKPFNKNGLAIVSVNNKWGLVNRIGQYVAYPKYSHLEFHDPNYLYRDGGYSGFINAKGVEKVRGLYEDFNENDMRLKKRNYIRMRQGDKYGFIKKSLDFVFEPKYSFIGNFSEGKASVGLNGFIGYIDSLGNEIIPIKYYWGSDFHKNFAAVNFEKRSKCDNRYHIYPYNTHKPTKLYNLNTKRYYPRNYSIVSYTNYSTSFTKNPYIIKPKLLVLYDCDKYGFIHRNGKILVKPKYNGINIISENIIAIKKDSLWGFVDTLGNKISDFKYEQIGMYSNGVITIKNNGKWGVIDTNYNYIVKPIYDKIELEGNCIKVRNKSGEGVVDDKGNTVIPLRYKNIYCRKGLIYVIDKGDWGIFDIYGNTIYDSKFSFIPKRINEMILVHKNEKYGLIDLKGKILLPFIYDRIKTDGKKYYFTKTNKFWKLGYLNIN